MLLWDLLGKFPGTDYESFNYDWIIGKLKELKDSVSAALASEQAAAESADEAHGNMIAATAQAARAKTYAEHSADSAAESAASAASIAGVADQVAVNTGRIDGLIAHAGDGTIPSELIDVRVQADGFTNNTAGNAVRAQTDFNLQAIMAFTAQAERLPEPTWNAGYLNIAGDVVPATANNEEYTSNFYEFDRNNFYAIYYEVPYGQQAWSAIGRYDKDSGAWLARWALDIDTYILDKIEINDNGRLIRFMILNPVVFNNNAKINFMARKYNTSAFRIYKIPADFYARNHSKIALLVPSGLGYVMNVNTASKIIDFPFDNVLVAYGPEIRRNVQDGPYQWKQLQAGSVDCSVIASSAVNIWYDIENEIYKATPFSDYYAYKNSNLYWIASIRFGAEPYISCMSAYRVDGVPLGITSLEAYRLSPVVKAINHRGYNTMAPENTLPAFKLSKKNGFDYIECDVQLTSDNIPVVIHDATINRTATNMDGTTISSPVYVNNETLQDLRQNYDFGRWFSPAYTGTTIPTWKELCELARQIGLHIYCEIKAETPWTQEQIRNLITIAKESGVYDNVTFMSFSDTIMGYVRTADQTVSAAFLSNTLTAADIDTAKALDASINCMYTSVSAEGVAYAAENNVGLEVWTVEGADVVNGLNPYITGVTSNLTNAAKVLYESNI